MSTTDLSELSSVEYITGSKASSLYSEFELSPPETDVTDASFVSCLHDGGEPEVEVIDSDLEEL